MRSIPGASPTPLNVYVSASSRGLAFEIARSFALSGANVALSSRSPLHLDVARAAIQAEAPQARIITIAGDASSVKDQEELLAALDAERFAPDIFVCSTGHPKEGSLSSLTRTDWAKELEMILGQAAFASQKFAPAMAEKGFGRVVFLSSLYAKAPHHEFFLSSLARAGVLALSKMVGQEYADRGVASFVICLGYIDTPLLRNRALGRPHDAPAPEAADTASWMEKYEAWASDIPAKRIASPQELAKLVAFLATPAADYLNGSVFSFSGGLDKGII